MHGITHPLTLAGSIMSTLINRSIDVGSLMHTQRSSGGLIAKSFATKEEFWRGSDFSFWSCFIPSSTDLFISLMNIIGRIRLTQHFRFPNGSRHALRSHQYIQWTSLSHNQYIIISPPPTDSWKCLSFSFRIINQRESFNIKQSGIWTCATLIVEKEVWCFRLI